MGKVVDFQEVSLRTFQNQTFKGIPLESRRYIGNKFKLSDWIFNLIQQNTQNCKSFLDIFAGTGVMSKKALPYYEKIIINDILHSNYLIYKAFFSSADWNFEKVNDLLQYYNQLNPAELPENYFSEHFGNKFFDYPNAKLIGYIREDLEARKNQLNEKEFAILLATLIYNIDKIANTVGHFDAYIKKKEIPYQKLELRLIEQCTHPNLEIYCQNANDLARSVEADIAYVDPPYNSRQYNRFYHVYENLAEWKKPPLFGIALKPKAENNSVYCTTKAKSAFEDLIKNLKVRYIAVSYNNTYSSKSSSSANKIQLNEIYEILSQKGETKVFEKPYKFFNAGKTEFENHKEFLFISRVY
ncbi:MAG: DNA adenine methylase [Raineya sp.]|nr:DNA adenine methylase [Raineya sp.]MDW8295401.1 DNA adenine methylase [Raineya sp.]